jgi:hypothetical protein
MEIIRMERNNSFRIAKIRRKSSRIVLFKSFGMFLISIPSTDYGRTHRKAGGIG